MERILIADDNESARQLLTCVLETHGYSVTEACDGVEALELVKESSPDLMLLDIQMPGMDGCEVCSHIKGRPDTRRIPVVLVSGLGDTADRAWQAGADGYVQKPFGVDALLDEVRRQLPAREAKRERETVGASASRWLSGLDGAKLRAAT